MALKVPKRVGEAGRAKKGEDGSSVRIKSGASISMH